MLKPILGRKKYYKTRSRVMPISYRSDQCRFHYDNIVQIRSDHNDSIVERKILDQVFVCHAAMPDKVQSN